jgi:GNAT superfamily N-acetyltransferase
LTAPSRAKDNQADAMGMTLIRYTERPELWDDTATTSQEVWPEYNLHGDVLNAYWPRLFDDFPGFQFVLYDEQERAVLAEGHTAPCPWDGTSEGLGEGIDAMIATAIDARAPRSEPTALCALAAEIKPSFQGRGLAIEMLKTMAALARAEGLGDLIAPVRPSLKEHYPLAPIERYARWRRPDGEPFDPWIRVHTRLGGTIVKPVPHSLYISGTVAEWEQWTGTEFPDDGEFTFPHGLAPVTIERARGLGQYWEPNVWIVHEL